MVAETESARDRFALRRDHLLADYAAISKKRRGAAEASALRLRSRQYLDILSAEASQGRLDWDELQALLRHPEQLVGLRLEPMVLAEIGRVLLLQQLEANDTSLGVNALQFGIEGLPTNLKSRRFRKLLVDHYIVIHEYATALELLDKWPDVDRDFYRYQRAELLNPFFVRAGGDLESWLENFNRGIEVHGLAPVRLAGDAALPFDRLVAGSPKEAKPTNLERGRTPKVSVIVTTFNPERTELATSVQSILSQTLSDIEVIIVDDASDAEHRENVVAVGAVDDRVNIVHAESNGGTYRARNLGLAAATGEYVTGQDDDDWSHPERLAEQVAFLESNPSVIGCRIGSFTCLPNLSRVRLGYKPVSANASSLMLARETFELAGGFLEARKAADTELHRRVEKLTRRPVVDIDKPLAIVRIEPESLSRSEFRAGWSHPARREFKFSYAHWHATATKAELAITGGSVPQVAVPRRFRVGNDGYPERFDVVFAGDWRQYGGPQKSMIEEIRALARRGFVVGVMQLEAPRFMTKVMKPLNPYIQTLINEGTVAEVLYDESLPVELLILRYPPILQFGLSERSLLQVKKMLILANQAPSELDGSDIRYLVPDCTENARAMFCEDVTWVPQGPQVRDAIEPYMDPDLITPFDIPGIVDPEEWHNPRRHRRGTLPVVGRHSRDNKMKWPENASIIEKTYPTSGRFDIRILGGASVPREVLGAKVTPAAWTVHETDALPVPTFLGSLDFYVFYQHSNAIEAFGRSILEAIAARLVVILPWHYEDVFGEAAVYADPREVQDVVMKFHNDRDLYMQQLLIADAVVAERFSHKAYADLVARILGRTEK